MRVEQNRWSHALGWETKFHEAFCKEANLVLLFGSRAILKDRLLFDEIKKTYPNAHFMGCSTSGEIHNTQVTDDTLVLSAVKFDATVVKGVSARINDFGDSAGVGKFLAESLNQKGLVHLFVLSDGLMVNGSDLVKGITEHLPKGIIVTGGLAGDGALFQETLVIWDGPAEPGIVAAIGLYGDKIKIGCGSLGGWDSFGTERLITKSKANVLYELDDKSALALYKRYLGEHASGLPATGLLFPLSIRTSQDETAVVRTLLAMNEKEGSLTFAGNMPEGAYARLMKANFNRLIDGAIGSAKTSHAAIGSSTPELAILISCVGRKLVLKQRIEEEVEGVREVLGKEPALTGFYSYGEISPFTPEAKCELHNQTMTITTLSEG